MFQAFSRRIVMVAVAAAVLGAIPGYPLLAAVPPSVAVREQPAAVEQIIQQLETKAATANGTWTTRSGRQDAPAQTWITGIDGKRWYWQSKADATSPDAGLTLLEDSEDVFVLPYGKDSAQGGVRFQYDTLRRFQAGDYLLGHYLLDMNLEPRQFIGALGGLSVVGEEQLDGTKVIHLNAEPKADTVAKGDTAISHQYGAGQVAPMDLYYDPQKRAIVKITIGDTGKGSHLEAAITAWDALGTRDTWPSKLLGKTVIVAGNNKTMDQDKPVLVTVEKFVAGKDGSLEAINQQVQKEPFFTTPYESLRTAAFYQKALTVQENASDRVALAQASFILADIAEGLKQWDQVDSKVQDTQGRKRLTVALSALSAGMLETAAADKKQTTACVALIKKFDDSFSDEEFMEVAGGVAPAWGLLRKNPDTRVGITAMNGTLVPKLARLGSVFVVEELVKLAEASKDDAGLIDPVLKQIIQTPVPATGYTGSQQNYLLLAAIRENAFDRAKDYLTNLRWVDGTTDAQKQAVTVWQQTLPVAQELKAGHDKSLEAAIGLYQTFSTKPLSDDRTNSTYGRWLLSNAGTELLTARLDNPAPENLITNTAKLEGAANFWGSIVSGIAGTNEKNPKALMQKIEPLLKTYEQTFNKPGFESDQWMRLATNPQIRGKFLGTELSYLNKALTTAPNDATRVKVINQIASTYATANEFQKGAMAVEGIADMVKNADQRAKIDKLAAALKAQASKVQNKAS